MPIAQYIDYARPLFPAISNVGVANTGGDVAQYSDFARNGFNVKGEGVKVGIISDSYNTILGNPALTDVVNGDLPGVGNPDDPNPVHVLRDYPYSRLSDEGRAMVQIVHDIAPKADLAFRTGFISAGDMAQGIRQLKQENCDVIVDDVTFITEPFFQDGVVSQAVDEVAAQGVSYFSAAGNFGSRSYHSTFNPAPAPSNVTGMAHDFGGGDIFQSLSLYPEHIPWFCNGRILFIHCSRHKPEHRMILTFISPMITVKHFLDLTGITLVAIHWKFFHLM